MVGTCHCSCRLQAAGQGCFCSRGSAAENISTLSNYHTIPPYPHTHVPSDISYGFQFKLDLDIIPQNTTYCSVAQSKEIKVFICNFSSHLSVNVSSYKHFMAIFVQRLLLIISAFNKEKSLQVSWRYLTFVSVNRYKGRT